MGEQLPGDQDAELEAAATSRSSGGAPTGAGTEAAEGPAAGWESLNTGLSADELSRCVQLMTERGGTTTVAAFIEADFSEGDLVAMGVKPVYAVAIVRGIDDYRKRVGYLRQSSVKQPSASPPETPSPDNRKGAYDKGEPTESVPPSHASVEGARSSLNGTTALDDEAARAALLEALEAVGANAEADDAKGVDKVVRNHPLLLAANLPGVDRAHDTCQALLRVLTTYHASGTIVTAALSALCRLTCTYGDGPHAQRRRKLGEDGGCEAVVAALHAHPRRESVVEKGVELILYLARESDNKRKLGGSGGANVVCMAMHNFPSSKSIQLRALSAIQNLSNRDYVNTRLLVGACEPVCDVMRAFEADREVQYQALGAMEKIAFDDDNVELLGTAGAAEVISTAMRTFANDLGLQSRALAAAINVACHNFDNKKRLVSAGVARLLCTAMKTFPREREVQYRGAFAIASLASYSSNSRALRSAGACEAVCAAMTSFPADVEIHYQGCGAVKYLARSSESSRKLGGPLHASELVCGAMRRFATDRDVQYRGCGAFVSLASGHGANRKALGNEGACELVCVAMRVQPEDADLIGAACLAVEALCEGSRVNKRRFEEAHVDALVEAAMETFHDSPRVRETLKKALTALQKGRLASNPMNMLGPMLRGFFGGTGGGFKGMM